MKYKYKFIYNFIYILSLLFVAGLTYLAYYATRYYYIFMPILMLVFIINLIAYIRQLRTYYMLGEFGLEKWYKDQTMIIQYENVITITESVLYYEIEYRTKSKVKTLYLSKLLKNFNDLQHNFEAYLKEKNERVIFL